MHIMVMYKNRKLIKKGLNMTVENTLKVLMKGITVTHMLTSEPAVKVYVLLGWI